jgi:hypothetical protein
VASLTGGGGSSVFLDRRIKLVSQVHLLMSPEVDRCMTWHVASLFYFDAEYGKLFVYIFIYILFARPT